MSRPLREREALSRDRHRTCKVHAALEPRNCAQLERATGKNVTMVPCGRNTLLSLAMSILIIALRRIYRRISARQKRVVFFHRQITPRMRGSRHPTSRKSIIGSVWYREKFKTKSQKISPRCVSNSKSKPRTPGTLVVFSFSTIASTKGSDAP